MLQLSRAHGIRGSFELALVFLGWSHSRSSLLPRPSRLRLFLRLRLRQSRLASLRHCRARHRRWTSSTRSLAVQRRILATDRPPFEDTPDPPSLVSDSTYFGSIDDIKINEDLEPEQQQQLRELCREFEDIFVRPTQILPQTDLAFHYINTGSARPIKRPPRRCTPDENCRSKLQERQ